MHFPIYKLLEIKCFCDYAKHGTHTLNSMLQEACCLAMTWVSYLAPRSRWRTRCGWAAGRKRRWWAWCPWGHSLPALSPGPSLTGKGVKLLQRRNSSFREEAPLWNLSWNWNTFSGQWQRENIEVLQIPACQLCQLKAPRIFFGLL